jgi:hypothetical protein
LLSYSAKIDWFVGAALASTFLLPLLGALADHSPRALGIPLLAALFMLAILCPQWYRTDADALVIRSGLRTWRIPYRDITAVRASADRTGWRNWSVALSLDRIAVEYRARTLVIAPRDQENFFADVATRCPHLSKRGQDLAIPFA